MIFSKMFHFLMIGIRKRKISFIVESRNTYVHTWTTSYFLHDLDFVSICFVLLLPVISILNSAFGCKNHKFQRITQGVIFQFHRLGTS